MSRCVLLVDDDPDIRELVSMSLGLGGGLDVLTAASGAEGVQVALRHRPDAVLLDMMMPGMDGPATLRRLRGHEAIRDVPVVLLTAKAGVGEQHRFADLEVRGVLTKPFDPSGLADELAGALGWELL